MGALVTICPKTGLRFDTGIDTDKTSMEMTPHFATEVDCPHCGETHLVASRISTSARWSTASCAICARRDLFSQACRQHARDMQRLAPGAVVDLMPA